MSFNIGDIVSRNSYGNDIIFKVVSIHNKDVELSGIDVRLCADSSIDDLRKEDSSKLHDDKELLDRFGGIGTLDRDEYFYMPGKVLHIDSDPDYLKRCMKFYDNAGIRAYGLNLTESDIALQITKYLEDLKPDIVIITGHDSYLKNKGNKKDLRNYKNSENFIKAIEAARKYEDSPEKLIIIAGACQSNYEELIKAGANFASSPKRINIHALDPAIVAVSTALSDRNKSIDLIDILNKTKYGPEGIGGIITNGAMYTGYPR